MTPERHRQIGKLFHAALELGPGQRIAFLDAACAGDQELRQEVESLLALDSRAEGFIESPALAVAAEMLTAEPAFSLVGRKLGAYQVLSPLGAGGMGEVYLAQDARLARKVALKLLPAKFTQDEGRVRRFEQEARATSALNHPNILTIYEIGHIDGIHFIATEFIDGQTLRQRMTREPMKLGEALDVAMQTASALAAAHEAGVVHRDIKPENIMLRRDSYVKVLDFGLAKLTEAPVASLDPEAPTASGIVTETGAVMGTVRYMSPEQARGQKVDARSDIFSLGVVLYEMLAGQVPFAGATTADMLVAILGQEPPPITRYLPEAPEALMQLIAQMLRKDRKERYPSAQKMLADLKSLKQRLEIEGELQCEASGGKGIRSASAKAPEANPELPSTLLNTNPTPLAPNLLNTNPSPSVLTENVSWSFISLSTRWRWAMGIALGLVVLVGASVAFQAWKSAPTEVGLSAATAKGPAAESSPAPVSAKPVEALRYYLEVRPEKGQPFHATGLDPLGAGQAFKFHFLSPKGGYLYLVSEKAGKSAVSLLTAQPVLSSRTETNFVTAGSDFQFPSRDDCLALEPGDAVLFTVILSPSQLDKPAFLTEPPKRKLTAAEQQELQAWREQFKGAAEVASKLESGQPIVTVSEVGGPKNKPLVFEILIKQQ